MATMYQKIAKYLTDKEVDDPYPTKSIELDRSKKLSEQIASNDSPMAEAAMKMGLSSGIVGGAGDKLKKLEDGVVKLAGAAEKKVAPVLSKVEQKAADLRSSRDPAIDLRADTAMDILGIQARKPTLSYGKGGDRAKLTDVKKLMDIIKQKKASGDVKSLRNMTGEWKNIKLDRK